MKRIRINPKKTASPATLVEELKPQPNPPVVRHKQAVTLRIGGRRYEMTWQSEVREIKKGPAKIIEMPKRSARKR
jgi:hypothetical protein